MGALLGGHLVTAPVTPRTAHTNHACMVVVVVVVAECAQLALLLVEERFVDRVRARQSRALLIVGGHKGVVVGVVVVEGVAAVGRGRGGAHLGLQGLEDERVDAALVGGDPERCERNEG